MPPAASVRENALANVVTTLEAVTAGASYNFTIDKVARVDGPFFVWLEQGHKTYAFVEEGLGSWLSDTHDGKWIDTVEVFVQAVTKYEPDAQGHPFEMTTETKSTLRSKLIADIVRALMADRTRGHYAKRGFLLTDDAPINLDNIEGGVWIPSEWVAHEFRFEMSIEVDEASP